MTEDCLDATHSQRFQRVGCVGNRGDGMRTESTAQTLAKVGEIIRQTPTTEIAQSCVVPILSEIALSLAAIADRLNETSGIEGISMDEVTE